MKAKYLISLWIFVLLVLGALLTTFYGFVDALNQHQSWSSILTQLGITLIVAAVGVFLIIRFTRMLDNLENPKTKESQKQKDIIQ